MAWHFNNLTTLTGSEQRAINNLSAFIYAPHIHNPTRHVFFQGRNVIGTADHHIHEFWWDGNWHHDDLTANTHAPLAANPDFLSSYMFKGTGTKHVIYQGFDPPPPPPLSEKNGRINELWWDGDWHHNDLTSAAGNAPFTMGAPFGYEYSFFDTIQRRNIISQRVVYLTLEERKLHLLHWVANDGWHQMPLPDVPGFPSLPTAYVLSVQGQAIQGQASQRVLFLAQGTVPDIKHVHELTWNEKGPNLRNWVLNDLTALTGAPPLNAGNPVGLMHDLEFTLHVFYGRDEGADLYELYWNDSGWHVHDLTAIMGRTIVGGRGPPLAYVHLQQGTLNVNFIGSDGHIHAIWREVGMPWNSVNQENLTLPIGAPPARTQPVGFVFRDLTQHMFYIAQNTDIIELTDEPP